MGYLPIRHSLDTHSLSLTLTHTHTHLCLPSGKSRPPGDIPLHSTTSYSNMRQPSRRRIIHVGKGVRDSHCSHCILFPLYISGICILKLSGVHKCVDSSLCDGLDSTDPPVCFPQYHAALSLQLCSTAWNQGGDVSGRSFIT